MMSPRLHTVYAAETPYWHRRIPFLLPTAARTAIPTYGPVSGTAIPGVGCQQSVGSLLHAIAYTGSASTVSTLSAMLSAASLAASAASFCRLGGCVGTADAAAFAVPAAVFAVPAAVLAADAADCAAEAAFLGSGRRDICFSLPLPGLPKVI